MPANCDQLQSAAGRIVTQLTDANNALDQAQEGYEQAVQAQQDALDAAFLCGGAVACVALALYAAARAELLIREFGDKIRSLLDAIGVLEGLYDEIEALLAHCGGLASWQVDAADELASAADALADEGDAVEIEDVDLARSEISAPTSRRR